MHFDVQVLNKEVGEGKYYKKKGVIEKVHDNYVGEVPGCLDVDLLHVSFAAVPLCVDRFHVFAYPFRQVRMMDSGHVLKIDQADLETVIPGMIGRLNRIVVYYGA